MSSATVNITMNSSYVLISVTLSNRIRADDSNYSENARVSDETAAVNQFQDYSKGNVTYLSRADGFANYAEATAAPSDDMYVMDDETREAIAEKSVARYDSTKYDNEEDEMPTTEADNGVKIWHTESDSLKAQNMQTAVFSELILRQ